MDKKERCARPPQQLGKKTFRAQLSLWGRARGNNMFKVYARLFAACVRGNCESHSMVEHSKQAASPLQSGTRQCLSDWSDVWQPSPKRHEEMQRERERHRQEGARLQNLVLRAVNATSPHDSSYRSDNHIVSDPSIASSSHSGHKRRVTTDGSSRGHNRRQRHNRRVTIDGFGQEPDAFTVLNNPFRDITYGRISHSFRRRSSNRSRSSSYSSRSEQDASPLQSGTRQCLWDWSDVWQPSPKRLEEMQRERERHSQVGRRLQNLVLNAINAMPPHDSSYRSDNNHIVSDSGIASSSHSGHNGHARNRRVTIDGSHRAHNRRPSPNRR
eukprot:5741677-Pyramimonas_sp.AAC.1